jgi:hypothetical protein
VARRSRASGRLQQQGGAGGRIGLTTQSTGRRAASTATLPASVVAGSITSRRSAAGRPAEAGQQGRVGLAEGPSSTAMRSPAARARWQAASTTSEQAVGGGRVGVHGGAEFVEAGGGGAQLADHHAGGQIGQGGGVAQG